MVDWTKREQHRKKLKTNSQAPQRRATFVSSIYIDGVLPCSPEEEIKFKKSPEEQEKLALLVSALNELKFESSDNAGRDSLLSSVPISREKARELVTDAKALKLTITTAHRGKKSLLRISEPKSFVELTLAGLESGIAHTIKRFASELTMLRKEKWEEREMLRNKFESAPARHK